MSKERGYFLDAKTVDTIYSRRAKRYEFFHHLFTRNRDTVWRQEAAWLASLKDFSLVLDLCAGVGLSAIEYFKVWDYQGLKNIHVTALDYNEKMLGVAKRKISEAGLEDRVTLVRGDVMDLKKVDKDEGFASFDDQSFDAVMCVCGIGGIEQSQPAYNEMLRVLKEGGRLIAIDLHNPVPGLHKFLSVQKWIWDKVTSPFLLPKIWGWKNPTSMIEQLPKTEITDSSNTKWRFEVLNKVVRQETLMSFSALVISIFAGKKIKTDLLLRNIAPEGAPTENH